MLTIEEWNYKKVAIFITHQIQRLFLENHSKLVTRGLPKRQAISVRAIVNRCLKSKKRKS